MRRAMLMLASMLVAGCASDGASSRSTDPFAPDPFSGARSEADLPMRMSPGGSSDYAFLEHMDKQDPRWSDREWRDQQRARRMAEIDQREWAERRRKEQARRRAAALEANGGY